MRGVHIFENLTFRIRERFGVDFDSILEYFLEPGEPFLVTFRHRFSESFFDVVLERRTREMAQSRRVPARRGASRRVADRGFAAVGGPGELKLDL